MLKIIFGEVENAVYHPPTYFDNQYEDEWITDPLTVAMIKDIDKSDVVGVHLPGAWPHLCKGDFRRREDADPDGF